MIGGSSQISVAITTSGFVIYTVFSKKSCFGRLTVNVQDAEGRHIYFILIPYAVTTCAKLLANVLPLFTRVPYNDVTELLHVPR